MTTVYISTLTFLIHFLYYEMVYADSFGLDILSEINNALQNVTRHSRQSFDGAYYTVVDNNNYYDDGFIEKNETFDFIIVGSGPSGAVIANRLTEIPEWRVLLIEAGDVPHTITDVPLICGTLAFTDYNWGYRAEKQEGFCKGCSDGRLMWPHGKALGGSSIINYMLYVRGNRVDYDRWADMGNPGWSFEDVLPYFLKSEDAHIEIQDPEYHQQGGYLSVSDVPFRSEAVHAYVRAAQEAGYSYVDYNGKEQLGVSYIQSTTINGRRCSAEKAFLRPVRARKNLKILTRARAVKILIDPTTKEAYGVKYTRNKKFHTAIASKEVIICAGGFNSPQLLMLSGIGPKDHLEELDIPVIEDLPVGQKMYDHPSFSGLLFQLNESVILNQSEAIADPNTYVQFLDDGKGPFTSLGGPEALVYIKTNVSADPLPSYPDMELIFFGASLSTDRGVVYRRVFNVPQETYDKVWKPLENKYTYQIFPMLVHPRSYGYIRLKSKNPFHWPKFYANYFTDPENHDIKTFIAAIREIQRINSSPSLQRYGSTMVTTPIPGCEDHVFDSDEYWECAIRTIPTTTFHQVATCKMGPNDDPEAVVNANLQVYGIKNLRVADVSVIPLPLTAHTVEPTYMVGEKASDIIKDYWGKNTK